MIGEHSGEAGGATAGSFGAGRSGVADRGPKATPVSAKQPCSEPEPRCHRARVGEEYAGRLPTVSKGTVLGRFRGGDRDSAFRLVTARNLGFPVCSRHVPCLVLKQIPGGAR